MTLGSAISNSLASLFGEREAPVPLPVAKAPVLVPADCTVISLNREERVERAFDEMPPNEGEARAIRALLDHPDSTGQQLSRICGWMDAGWMTQMVMLCQRRRRFLCPAGVDRQTTNGIILGVLADYDAETSRFRPRETLVGILTRAVNAAQFHDIEKAS